MEIPRFDGTDPLVWIFKTNHFFNFYNTPEEQRISVAPFLMDGQELNWFEWMYNNSQLRSWPNLLHSLHTRFSPSQFDDPQDALFKLTQTSSVREYQCQFENLCNPVVGLPITFY